MCGCELRTDILGEMGRVEFEEERKYRSKTLTKPRLEFDLEVFSREEI